MPVSDVFISYARSTTAQAERAHAALGALGYAVWRDNDLAAHQAYGEVIEAQVRGARVVLALWSSEAVKSHWVRSEANVAREQGKLVQVRVDGASPPMPFDQIHCADLSGWQGEAAAPEWARVVASIAEIAGAPKPPSRAEAPARAVAPLLAVLAFDNLSGDADFRYFSDGISEEILHTVAKTTDLRVVGRSSSFQLRGADKAARRVASELGATHVLDGSVRRSGERVRITTQLVDCATQTPLWSDRFDRSLADVFALQDEIAQAVAEALKAAFAPSPNLGPIDPEAFDLYLRARDQGGADRAGFDIDLLEKAVAKAPTFAQAWALLAFARAIVLLWLDRSPDQSAARDKVRDAADKALALDPAAGVAFLARDMVEPLCGHYAHRLTIVDKALQAAPHDPLVLLHAGGIQDILGHQRLAFGYVSRAYELDPRYAAFYYPTLLDGIGLRADAVAAIERDMARWPDAFVLPMVATRLAYESGDWARYEAIVSQWREVWPLVPLTAQMIAIAEQMRNWTPATGEAFLADLRRDLAETGSVPISWLGFPVSQGLGDEIFDILDQASFEHLHQPGGRLFPAEVSLNIIFSPSYAPVRQDRRFVRLCAKLGLCDYWLASGHWPDCAETLAPFYDFEAEARRLASGAA